MAVVRGGLPCICIQRPLEALYLMKDQVASRGLAAGFVANLWYQGASEYLVYIASNLNP